MRRRVEEEGASEGRSVMGRIEVDPSVGPEATSPCGESRQTFGPTDLLFAAAGVEHRFENFSDDLTLWVMFYGPEAGESNGD